MAGTGQVSAEAGPAGVAGLHRLSLVTHDPGPTQPRAVRMHNLTGRAVSGQWTPRRGGLVRAAADALVEVWPEIENNPALSEALRANTDALTRPTRRSVGPGRGRPPGAVPSGRSLEEAGLVGPCIELLHRLADQAAAAASAPTTRHPDRRGTTSPSPTSRLGDLGRAIPLYEQTLADRERVLGPDHPDTLASRNNLACAYQAAGDLGRAIPLFEQTLADRERVLGPDHPDTLTSRNNLASPTSRPGTWGGRSRCTSRPWPTASGSSAPTTPTP